jgi:DNA-binding transcriptional MerR regulator
VNPHRGTLIECKDAQVLKIGELARISGLRTQTIRNYEQHSLLKPAARSKAGQHRLYGDEEVARLQFIRQANLAGLALREVKELLARIDGGQRGENIAGVREALEKNIRDIEQKMELLSAFRDSLLTYRWRFEEKEDQGQL